MPDKKCNHFCQAELTSVVKTSSVQFTSKLQQMHVGDPGLGTAGTKGDALTVPCKSIKTFFFFFSPNNYKRLYICVIYYFSIIVEWRKMACVLNVLI